MTKEEILSKLQTIKNNNALPEKQKGMLIEKYEKMLAELVGTSAKPAIDKIVEKATKAVKPKRTRQPKAPKSKAEGEEEPDCDQLFKDAEERKKKALIAYEKRKNAPKKSPATKNKEAIEKIDKGVEKRAKKGDVSVSEIEKLISEYEDAIKSLRTLLTKIKADGKMAHGGGVGEDYSMQFRKIKDHHCGCNDKMAKGGILEHGLQVGDEIMTSTANLVFVRKNGKMYVININTGKRLTQSEFDKMDNRSQNDFSKMAKGGGIYSSDERYEVTLQNQDTGDLEVVVVRARNQKEAIEIAEEESGYSDDWKYYSVTKSMAKGGNLKPIPEGNKGLSKLPTSVRNKMGFMEKGGGVEPTRKQMLDYLNMYFDYYSELRTIAIEEDNILTRKMLPTLDDEQLEMAYDDAKYEIKADTEYGKGGSIKVGDTVTLPEIKMKNGDVQFEKVENGEVIYITDGIYGVKNPKTNRIHQVTSNQIKMAKGGGVDYIKVGSKIGFLRPNTGRYEYADVLSIDGDKVILVVRHPKRKEWDNYFTETKERINKYIDMPSEDWKDGRMLMKIKYEQGGSTGWHKDHYNFNKAEDYEKSLEKRKVKARNR